MRLLRAELWRFRSRLLIRWIAVGTLVIAGLVAVGAYVQSAPMPEDQVAMMRADYDATVADYAENGAQYLEDCRAQAEEQGLSDEEWGCTEEAYSVGDFEDWIGPPSEFGWDEPEAVEGPELSPYNGTPVEDLPAELRSEPLVGMEAVEGASWSGVGNVLTLLPVFVLLGLVTGVTFTAAEMSSGAISNWLTFEPRRRRVFWSKASGAALGTLPIALVGIAVAGLGSYAAYGLHDAYGTMGSEQWGYFAGGMARALVAAVVAAVVGASLGILLRHTAIVAGVVVGWFVVAEFILGLAMQVSALTPYLLSTNLVAWIQGGTNYQVTRCVVDDTQGEICEGVNYAVSTAHGGIVLGAVAVVVTLFAVLVFRRRDVG
ncbi:ABC-2 type transport system permease protein [Sediminihabitans luteus]|uniref:ABC-2 type transport system permease protein n=1 Tax=Sediminihabitans luteus TaxID=1138585 RepID=A0A2M9CPD2_9CELL|nr:ABC transporter permease subunit [Sediminihabitans luteus]PJJ73757.1 ABC-2 type transport system permease protein [Sediminihabitans luteus]GIJ00526.1 hypothetical protein Slu03_29030 [Sediminihabitans luteus]